jgi:hypothetical protein
MAPRPTSLLVIITPACTSSPTRTSPAIRGVIALIYIRFSVISVETTSMPGVSASTGSVTSATWALSIRW